MHRGKCWEKKCSFSVSGGPSQSVFFEWHVVMVVTNMCFHPRDARFLEVWMSLSGVQLYLLYDVNFELQPSMHYIQGWFVKILIQLQKGILKKNKPNLFKTWEWRFDWNERTICPWPISIFIPSLSLIFSENQAPSIKSFRLY